MLAGVVLLSAPAAAAQRRDSAAERKIDRKLRESLREGRRTQRVIITMKPGCRASMRTALEEHGDAINGEHALIDALSAEAHSEDVEELADNACVQAVAADAEVYSDGARNRTGGRRKISGINPISPKALFATLAPKPPPNVLRETLGLPSIADSGTMTGATGVGVVIIDSGIAPSADFSGRVTGFYDFTRGGIRTAPFDDFGHGTHIAGLIGSSGMLSNYEFQGIAPDVHMIGLKVLDGTGQGRTSDVISALEFTIANRYRLNAHIVNLSLGHEIFAPAQDDPLVQAVEKATEAGLIVVVSAGNNGLQKKSAEPGYTGITSPGNAPSAITVGAAMTADTVLRDDDSVAPYSSKGPTWFDAFAKPDVVAPGHRLPSNASLTSYLYKNLPGNQGKSYNGQPVLLLSGSSMATGVTSGVVALVLQQHNQNGQNRQKALTANLVKAMLQFSAVPVADADFLTQGTGEINAAGAIALAKVIDTSKPVGEWWLSTGITPSSVIGNQIYAWSQEVIWGDDVLTGNVLYYNSALWTVSAQRRDNIIWGTVATRARDNIIWGTAETWAPRLVWDDRLIGQLHDADNVVWGTWGRDNVVWGTLRRDNIVWGTWNGDTVVWATWRGDNIVWGTSRDNIIWGTGRDNIVWGTGRDNIIWGTGRDNIIWGTSGLF